MYQRELLAPFHCCYIPAYSLFQHIHYSEFPGVVNGLIRARRCRWRGGLVLKRIILSNTASLATPGIPAHVTRFREQIAARDVNVGFTRN
jgi:hypothetical protein